MKIKNWTIPFKITIFLTILMSIVFVLEALSLTNKEKNLLIRNYKFDYKNYKQNKIQINGANIAIKNFPPQLFENKILEEKERNVHLIKSILINAADNQEKFNLRQENDLEFYDF